MYNLLMPIPDPITVTPFHFLSSQKAASDRLSLGKALSNPNLDMCNLLGLKQYEHTFNKNTQKAIITRQAHKTPCQIIFEAYHLQQPNTLPIVNRHCLQAQPNALFKNGLSFSLPSLKSHTPLTSYSKQPSDPLHDFSLNPYLSHPPPDRHSLLSIELQQNTSPTQMQSDSSANTVVPVTVNESVGPANPNTRSLPATVPRQKKRSQAPTRRSKRLQARQQTAPSQPDTPKKAKTKTVRIPFDLEKSMNPLDVSTTLALLQATGLHITEQVEQLVDDAIKRDQTNALSDQAHHLPHCMTLFLLSTYQELISCSNY